VTAWKAAGRDNQRRIVMKRPSPNEDNAKQMTKPSGRILAKRYLALQRLAMKSARQNISGLNGRAILQGPSGVALQGAEQPP